jgi:transcriptional regulator with XRE-family HTH domain
MIDRAAVGRRLQAIRRLLGLGRHELAQTLDIAAAHMAKHESAGVLLPVEVADKLADAVPGLTLDWLYRGRTEGIAMQLLLDVAANEEDAKAEANAKSAPP